MSQFIEIGKTGREFGLIGKLQVHFDMHWNSSGVETSQYRCEVGNWILKLRGKVWTEDLHLYVGGKWSQAWVCIQQNDSVVHIHIFILFQILLPVRLLHNIEHSSLCYTLGPWWLSILNTLLYLKWIAKYLFIQSLLYIRMDS